MILFPEMQSAIALEAARIKVPPNHLTAVVAVESGGVVSAGLPNRNKPVIRIEGHYFDARLTGPARDEARKMGLSNPSAGKVKNPTSQKSRYDILNAMVALCNRHGLSADAAYESCSWGIGQVMGAAWKTLGYATCGDFVKTVCNGFAGQLKVMVQFIVANRLDDELREGRWASFARGYNGKNFRKNRYDELLAKAANENNSTVAKPDGFLRMGSKGARVREVQALLVTAGYAVKIDGDFGLATRDALKAFQKKHNITVDGVYGPQTVQALAAYTEPGAKPGAQKIAEVPAVQRGVLGGGTVAAGIAVAKEGLQQGVDSLTPYTGLPIFEHIQGYLTLGVTVAVLAGLAYAGYGWLRSRKTTEV